MQTNGFESNLDLDLKVGWLCPDILQAFCDEVNVEAFKFRAQARDIKIEIIPFDISKKVKECDFYYIGGSKPSMFPYAIKYLKENSKIISEMADNNIPMLAVNLGFQLLSTSYQHINKPEMKGLGIINAYFDYIEDYENAITGNIIGACNFLANQNIVGYKNQNALCTLKDKTAPFMKVTKGTGNNKQDPFEGARYNNVIATSITSPILPQNPHFCDYLIGLSLRCKYGAKIYLSNLTDDIEWYSHNYLAEMK